LPLLLPEFYTFLLIEIMILGLLGMAVNLLVGYTGMISFGHAAFYGIGAYSLGLLLVKTNLPFVLAIVLCPLVTTLFGLVIGWFSVRLAGFYFAMLTLAIGQFIWGVIFKWYSFTGGDDGLTGIPIPSVLSSTVSVYYLVLAVLLGSMIAMAFIINSPFGWTMRAIRENPQRVRFLGINMRRYRLAVFVISTFFSGLAGGLYVVLVHGAFAEYAFWAKSGEAIIVALIGGMFSLFGPLVGAGVLMILQHIVVQFTEYWSLVVGLLLLVVALFIPFGVMGIGPKLKGSEAFRNMASVLANMGRKSPH
jgi:branched-chain amino acid transport system permease protein